MKVAIALPNTPETVSLVYAVNRAGAIAVMLHPLSTVSETADILVRAECACAFCLPQDAAKFAVKADCRVVRVSPAQSLPLIWRAAYRLQRLRVWLTSVSRSGRESRPRGSAAAIRRSLSWSRFLINKGEGKIGFPRRIDMAPASAPAARDGDIALIMGSGGTDGVPKFIELSNAAVHALAGFAQTLNRSEANDGLLCLMPFFHGFGLCFCLHSGLLGGKRCVLMPQYTDRLFARTLRREKPSYLVGVPIMYERMAANPHLRKAGLEFVLGAACGGDVMSEKVFRQVNDFFAGRGCGCRIQMGYGLTECVTACTFTPENRFKSGRIGVPFEGMKLKIASEVRGQLPPGTPGEIWVSGPTLMSGYLGDPASTANALQRDDDGVLWLRTGDIGLLDEEGFFVFLQRMKRVIKIAGYNVFPGTVETVLEAHPLVKHACVVQAKSAAAASDDARPALVAFIQTNDAPENLEAELLELCRERLNPFHRPSRVIRLEHLPLTRMKKVDAAALERIAGEAVFSAAKDGGLRI